MCYQSVGQYLSSPSFALNSLPGIKFYIKLYPRSYVHENYIAVFLKRNDDIPENCKIKYNVKGLACNGKLLFSYNKKMCVYVFKVKSGWGYKLACNRNSLFQSLINDTLIIKYKLEPVCKTNQQEILPQLSYKNQFLTDVVLRASGAVFSVHKAILQARWPKLVEKLDAENTCEQVLDIRPDALEAMMEYVYTGNLHYKNPELLVQLHIAAAKYKLPNLQCAPIVAQKGRTNINVEKISFEWPIKNFSLLPINTVLHTQTFTFDKLKCRRWNLIFHMREDAIHGRIFDISICIVYHHEYKPILVRSKISFVGTNSSENEHLFESDKIWKCAQFSRSISTNKTDVLLLKCEFKFSNCSYSSEIVESSCVFTSSIDCQYFNFSKDLRNLYESGKLSDVNIVVDSKTFSAHKFILCARSSVFSRMFQTEMTKSKKNTVYISDVDPNIIHEMLIYMYTGYLETPLQETALKLYAAADKYDVFILKKKCSSFLESNFAVENLCEVLQLAYLHSDDDLYESVLEYTSDHADDLFLSDKWNKIVKDNLLAKLLQDVVLRMKKNYKRKKLF